ncbi:MAG: cupin domain-containing protein [Candidatus Brocadiia bacterium]
MGYSVLSEAEAGSERIEADWGSLTWLAGHARGNAEGLTLGRVIIHPGCRNPSHRHPNCEEALYLLSGRLRHFIGPEEVTLEAGDTLVISAGEGHYAVNIGDQDADMIVAYSSGRRGFEHTD